ncbi:MAG: pyridoxamine 5'-phosphate oxidase family protein [Clostridia bacterium]|nr:pyridoxamine 5'-phosphate oxidase family protein [Clostridia bacterium]
MRRSEREVNGFDDMVSIIAKCEILRLAFADGGVPYIVPVNFGYSAQAGKLAFYFHSAPGGRKIDLIRRCPVAGFEMDCSFRLVKGGMACKWSAEYESVSGEGHIAILEQPSEKKQAMDIIMKRYGFEGTPEYDPVVLSETALLRMQVDRVTGKRCVRQH